MPPSLWQPLPRARTYELVLDRIEEQIRSDTDLLSYLARFLEGVIEETGIYTPTGIVEDCSRVQIWSRRFSARVFFPTYLFCRPARRHRTPPSYSRQPICGTYYWIFATSTIISSSTRRPLSPLRMPWCFPLEWTRLFS